MILPSLNEKEFSKDFKVWPESGLQLFWHAIAATRARETDGGKRITAWRQVSWEIGDFWVPKPDDLERLFEDMKHQPLMDDRTVALTAIFTVYVNEKRPRQLREQMKRGVAGTTQLEAKLYELLHPKPLTDENKKWRRQERDFKRRQEANEKHQKAIRQEWQQKLKQKPAEIRNVGNAEKGEIWRRAAYLYDRIREKRGKDTGRWGYSDWRVLIGEFGHEVARNFRDGSWITGVAMTPSVIQIDDPIIPCLGHV